jgi:hypothetical protein
MWTTDMQILVFSVYIPPAGIYQTPEEVSIQQVLDEIHATIQRETGLTDKPTTIITAGDFNRHHPAWSSNSVHHVTIEHAEELVNFFYRHGLQWCLPRGTPTFWSLSQPGKTSTIDLTLTDSHKDSSNANCTRSIMGLTIGLPTPSGRFTRNIELSRSRKEHMNERIGSRLG